MFVFARLKWVLKEDRIDTLKHLVLKIKRKVVWNLILNAPIQCCSNFKVKEIISTEFAGIVRKMLIILSPCHEIICTIRHILHVIHMLVNFSCRYNVMPIHQTMQPIVFMSWAIQIVLFRNISKNWSHLSKPAEWLIEACHTQKVQEIGQECIIFNCLHMGSSVTSAVLRSKGDNKRIFLVFKCPDFLREHRLVWTKYA